MATNKHASIRYIALDKCFSNFGRMYFIDDLLEACNKALYDYTGIGDGVKKRQLYEDINFMQSEQGWEVPLEKFKHGKQVYYRYSDPNFSISKKPITQEEAKQLKEAMSILLKFKGMPQFEWIDELGARLDNVFQSGTDISKVVDFEENQFLEGINHFADAFNLILNKRVATIKYRGFKQLVANFNSKQIEFVNLIIDYFAVNGVMKTQQLFEAPFKNIHSLGVVNLFGAETTTELTSVINEINSNCLISEIG